MFQLLRISLKLYFTHHSITQWVLSMSFNFGRFIWGQSYSGESFVGVLQFLTNFLPICGTRTQLGYLLSYQGLSFSMYNAKNARNGYEINYECLVGLTPLHSDSHTTVSFTHDTLICSGNIELHYLFVDLGKSRAISIPLRYHPTNNFVFTSHIFERKNILYVPIVNRNTA